MSSIPALSDLDSRLESLRTEYLSLCGIRNLHYSATSKLPPEVLTHIFECVQRIPLCNNGEKGLIRRHYNWVKEVTHVCRNWRSVALASPRLWSSALLCPFDWACEALQRTRSAPVDLVFPTLGGDALTQHAELFKLAFANPEQIRSIAMIVDAANDSDVLETTSQLVGSSSMSLLERISVQSCYAACLFPDDLFSTPGSVPRLQAVRLLNCTIDLNTLRFRNLRVLDIRADTEQPRTGILLSAFCKAIREMRSLEILKLDGVFSLERETAESELPSPLRIEPFELPSLRKISLKSDQLIGLDIFEFIRAPRIRDLTIATFPILLIKDINTIYSFFQIGPSTSTDKRRNTQRMGIASVNESLNWSVTHSQSDGVGHRRTLSLNAIGVELERLWASIIHDAVHSFKLTLSPRELPPEAPVLYVMLRLADLRALAVLQVPFMAFAEESFLTAWEKYPSFPKLRSLALDCLGRKPRNTTLLRLRDWLMQREGQGFVTLDGLIIFNCPHFKPSIAEQLKVVVKKFRHLRKASVADEDD